MYHSKAIDEDLQLHTWGISCMVMEPEEQAAYPSRNDLLWKGILEEVFDDFLRFFFPDADTRFDLKRGFEYLNKELEQIFEPENEQFAPRHVDKLIKIFTAGGEEAWILCHCEVQGYSQGEFPERMFRYYCRLWDKYARPITAIAILTDGDESFHSDRYEQSFMGTRLSYRFNSYKVLDQSEIELEQSDNPFAMVILTAKAALKGRQEGLTQEQLYALKLDLAKRFNQKQIPEKKRRALMKFLRYYLRFQKEAMNTEFDKAINKITGRTKAMTMDEILLAQARHEGKAKLKKKELSIVQALITDTDFDNKRIAYLASVTETFVEKIRTELSVAVLGDASPIEQTK